MTVSEFEGHPANYALVAVTSFQKQQEITRSQIR
jgi:hypothetical protein